MCLPIHVSGPLQSVGAGAPIPEKAQTLQSYQYKSCVRSQIEERPRVLVPGPPMSTLWASIKQAGITVKGVRVASKLLLIESQTDCCHPERPQVIISMISWGKTSKGT